MVLIISGEPSTGARTADSPDSIIARVRSLEKEGLEPKEALKKAAREFGLKRAEAYRLLVAQKNRRSK